LHESLGVGCEERLGTASLVEALDVIALGEGLELVDVDDASYRAHAYIDVARHAKIDE
jgi:hypothetical protein